MPVNLTKPRITLERADNNAFSANVATIVLNVIAVPVLPNVEEVLTDVDGHRKNTYSYNFEVEFFPFSTRNSTTDHDTSDVMALVQFLKTAKCLRIKSISTLARYGGSGIPSVKTMIENRAVRVVDISASLDKKAALETISLTLESAKPL